MLFRSNFKKKFPTKEEVENSDWTSCCTGPILKKDLEDNFWVCNACGKHHRTNCLQRFDIFFGKENYEIIKTPIPGDENPLKWEDVKPYKNRLADAKKKTGQDCAIMVAKGKINNIEVIAAASNFEFLGGSVSIAESEAIVYAVQNAIDNKIPFVNFSYVLKLHLQHIVAFQHLLSCKFLDHQRKDYILYHLS